MRKLKAAWTEPLNGYVQAFFLANSTTGKRRVPARFIDGNFFLQPSTMPSSCNSSCSSSSSASPSKTWACRPPARRRSRLPRRPTRVLQTPWAQETAQPHSPHRIPESSSRLPPALRPRREPCSRIVFCTPYSCFWKSVYSIYI